MTIPIARRVVSACALAGVAAVAPAQLLTLDQTRIDVRPGGVVAMTLMLVPDDAQVAGIVATLRSKEKGDALDWSRATATTLIDGGEFNVAIAPIAEGAAPGVRLVVYAPGDKAPVLSGPDPVAVARVLVPVRVGSRGTRSGEVAVELPTGNAADGQPHQAFALQGSGEMKPGAEPFSAIVSIVPAEAPSHVDFGLTGAWPGWVFVPHRPDAQTGQPVGINVVGEGLRMRAVNPDSFATWQADTAADGPWLADVEDPGALRVVDWVIGSNATGTATPPVRLRLDHLSGVATHDVVVRDLESNGKDGVSITPRSDGRRYRQLIASPSSARAATGWGAAFDLVQFGGQGTLGRGVWLNQMTHAIVPPEDIGVPIPIAERSLVGAGGKDWKTGPAAPAADVVAVAYLRGPRGLGVRLPATPSPATLGSWWMPLEFSPTNADEASWFRLDVDATIEPGAALRWRVASANQEWQSAWRFEADEAAAPRTLSLWWQTPTGLDGQPLLFAFDVLPGADEAPAAAPGATPTVVVASWKLGRLDAPAIAALP